jgi:hypothetical protein
LSSVAEDATAWLNACRECAGYAAAEQIAVLEDKMPKVGCLPPRLVLNPRFHLQSHQGNLCSFGVVQVQISALRLPYFALALQSLTVLCTPRSERRRQGARQSHHHAWYAHLLSLGIHAGI